MSQSSCPMCGSDHRQVVESVTAQAIVDGYKLPGLAVDVSAQFAANVSSLDLIECGACGLKWFAPMVPGDGPFYVALQKHDWYYQPDKPEFEFARQNIHAGCKVLEVGCGRGAFRRFLPDDVSFRGLEFNTGAVQMARQIGLDVEIKDIAEEAKERPGTYDVVCHFQVLEHVPDPGRFLAACVGALRPGGTLIVAVPAEDSFIGLVESSWLNMPPHHVTRWTDQALQNAFRTVGVAPGPLWHEPVAPIHRDWHFGVMVTAGFKSLFGQRPSVAHPGWLGAIASRLRRRALVADALFQRGLKRFPQGKYGHTVCLVGTKQ